MGEAPDPDRITITIVRGLVENVFTSLPLALEVDILDFDGDHSKEELADMNAYLEDIRREHKQLL